MGRRRNFAPMPTKEELEDLYLPDRQNKRQIDLAGHYGVSRDTIKDWLNLYGIEKSAQQRELAASAPTRQAKPLRDPKRVAWLDADGAPIPKGGPPPPLRPTEYPRREPRGRGDVAAKPTRQQAFVIAEARQKSAPAPVTPAEAAPLLRKARHSPHGERAHAQWEAMIAYKFRKEYALWPENADTRRSTT